jgi:predicted permease
MSIFASLLAKIIPLYLNILLGYIANKFLDVNRDSIAKMMVFLINPIIIFNGVMNVDLKPSILTLPILTFSVASGLCVLFYHLSKQIWQDSTKNIMAFSAGSGNTGYFGLPLALLLFDNEGEGIYVLAILGITLYENSLGYYVLAKGSYPAWECIKKLIRLPSIYAFFGGLLLNSAGFELPQILVDFMVNVKGAFAVLGMMIIGLGLASLSRFQLDRAFLGMTFAAKFVAWPAVILIINGLDTLFFGVYSTLTHQALTLLSIVPMAANTVILSSLLKAHPEKASAAVFISCLIAMFYVPFMISYFILPIAP